MPDALCKIPPLFYASIGSCNCESAAMSLVCSAPRLTVIELANMSKANNRVKRFPCPRTKIDFLIAADRKQLSAAYELVYQCYLRRGLIAPHDGKIVYRPAFGHPTSRTFVGLTEQGELLGTLTLVGDNPHGFQLEQTFADEISRLRASQRRLAEITCLAIKPMCDTAAMAVFFGLTRLMIHYAIFQRFDDLLIAVHPRHQRFYCRRFLAYPIGEPRSYDAVKGKPAVCCRIELARLHQQGDRGLWQQYFGQPVPERLLAGGAMQLADHIYFCRRAGISDFAGQGRSECDAPPATAPRRLAS